MDESKIKQADRLGRFGSGRGRGRFAARLHARLNRLTGGRVGGRWFGVPVLVMETVGRRSGRARANPLIYLRRGEQLIVVAADGGSDRTPAWWLNLREAGEATVVIDGERRRVRARVLEGAERDQAWSEFVEMWPLTEDYTHRTDRELPCVALEPA